MAALAFVGAHVVVHVQVVHEVADLVELGAAPPILADEHLLLAVGALVDAHQLVVLAEGLQRLDLDVLVAGGVLREEILVVPPGTLGRRAGGNRSSRGNRLTGQGNEVGGGV